MEKLALRDTLARMVAHKGEPAVTDAVPARDAAVLIVDDSRTVVRALQLFLERDGYLTYTASDGAQALPIAKRHRPDLILMDIVMPVMNGFEAMRALARDPDTAGIPVILVSGTEQPVERVWGTRLGAKGLIAKPVSRDELLVKTRSVIAVSRRALERQQAAVLPVAQIDPLQG